MERVIQAIHEYHEKIILLHALYFACARITMLVISDYPKYEKKLPQKSVLNRNRKEKEILFVTQLGLLENIANYLDKSEYY